MRSFLASAALAVIVAAVPAVAAPAHHWHSPCDPPLRANGRQSLVQVATNAATPISQIIESTVRCNGGHLPGWFAIYVNKGSLKAPMQKTTRYWLSIYPLIP